MITEITTETQATMLDNTKLNILYFTTPTCPPCKMLRPILDEVSEELSTEINIVKVDATVLKDLVMEHTINSVPTLIYIKDNNVLDRTVGMMSKEKLMDKINELKN